MMLGARTGAWAKSGYTARDYVQDGLIAMWDGEWNAGDGLSDSQNRCVDLSGNGITLAPPTGSGSYISDGFIILDAPGGYTNFSFSISTPKAADVFAVEVLCDRVGGNQTNGQIVIARTSKTGVSIGWSGDVGGKNEQAGGFYNNNLRYAWVSGFKNVASRFINDGCLFISSVLTYGNSMRSIPFPSESQDDIVFGQAVFTNRCYANVRRIALYETYSASVCEANYAVDKARFNLPDKTI